MRFFIITPTYNRDALLKRCMASVSSQKNVEYIHYIVDDSTDKETEILLQSCKDPNIIYIRNQINIGSNASKNKALDHIYCNIELSGSGYILFLDDDDYLSHPFALFDLSQKFSKAHSWYVSQRIYAHGNSITVGSRGEGLYDYVSEYLLGKRLSGDATHAIHTDLIRDVRFARDVKNGEEWIFFIQIAEKSLLYFIPLPTTSTDGYLPGGLTHTFIDTTFRRRMLVRMYRTLGRRFPHIIRIKVIFAYIYYMPFIYHFASWIRKWIGSKKS